MGLGDTAAAIHRRMCDDPRFGYSWAERWGATAESWTVGGKTFPIAVGDYDCSSSTITAWRKALTGTKYAALLDGATYTGNMRMVFLASGLFEWKPASYSAQPGDLWLNEANHVAMCQGGGRLSEFSSSETGGIYGVRGDQTGWESHVCGWYSYPWDGVLHYNGKADLDDLSDAYDFLTAKTDVTGRGKPANMRDRLAWMAAKQESMQRALDDLERRVDRLAESI